MANNQLLIANPEELGKQLAQSLYTEIESATRKEILNLIEPTVQKLTEERLKQLKLYMERDFFGGAMILKVILNDKELNT
jgi:hypothetical protein